MSSLKTFICVFMYEDGFIVTTDNTSICALRTWMLQTLVVLSLKYHHYSNLTS